MNLKNLYNDIMYMRNSEDWKNKTAEDIAHMVEFVKQHWFYQSKIEWYALGALIGLYWGCSVLWESEFYTSDSNLRNILMINSACFVCYLGVLLIRRFFAVFMVGDPDDVLFYLSPLSNSAERCATTLNYASTEAGAAYRDAVLEQGRELLVIDQYVMAQLAWKELEQREIDSYSQACKKLHKIS